MKPNAVPGDSSSGERRQPVRPPPNIPDHEVLRRIGSGSYGEVWLVKNVMGSYRAVKVVYRNQFADARPYDREFEGIRNFEPVSRSHPSQVNIFHVGRKDAEGYFYYVMELADDQQSGQQIDPERYEPKTLRSVLKERSRLPAPECLRISLALTTALKHLHGAGLIHRDIKPSNVIFVHGLPKLADIGLVAATGDECSFVGTDGYVANEGPGKVQADIYSLGKVLYEMLTGLSPARYPSLPDDWVKTPDPDAQDLNEVVLKACDANLARRYQTAEEMEVELRLREAGKSLRRMRWLERTVRRTLVASGVVVGVVLLAALVFGFFVFKKRATEQRVRSELRQIQIDRTKNPKAGWFAANWPRLEKAGAASKNSEILEQASAMLAGFDARLVRQHDDVTGGSGAFGPDGRAIISGLGTSAAMLMDTNGDFTALPVTGEGPVCWTDDDVPLQLSIVSNRLVLREAMTGAVRRQFLELGTQQSYESAAPILALSPDGQSVAAALNGKVLVWLAAAEELLGEVTADFSALAFSPDGSRLGIGEMNGTTQVRAVRNLTNEVVVIKGTRTIPIRALAFVRDPLIPYDRPRDSNAWLLATGNDSNEIVIWDLLKRQPSIAIPGPKWRLTSLAFHPEGLVFASVGQSYGTLADARRGQPLLDFITGTGPVRFITFDREGRRLIWGTESGAGRPIVGLYELEFGQGITPLRGLRVAVRKVWFSPDGQKLAALSDEWRLGIWETDSNKLVALLEAPVGNVADSAGGAFDRRGNRFAFASWKEACLFDLSNGQTIQRWPLREGFCDQLVFDPDGQLLLLRREVQSETHRWIWRLYELAESERPALLHQQTNAHWSPVGMTFLIDGKRFLVWHGGNSETEGSLRAFDTATGREIWRTATGRSDGDLRVFLDPSGRRFAHDSKSGQPLRLFRLPDFQPIGLTAKGCNALGPTGEQFLLPPSLISGQPGDDRFPLWTDWAELAYVAAFSPDGNLLARGTEEGEVLVAHIPILRRRLSSLLK